jgi:hypothetical protein
MKRLIDLAPLVLLAGALFLAMTWLRPRLPGCPPSSRKAPVVQPTQPATPCPTCPTTRPAPRP